MKDWMIEIPEAMPQPTPTNYRWFSFVTSVISISSGFGNKMCVKGCAAFSFSFCPGMLLLSAQVVSLHAGDKYEGIDRTTRPTQGLRTRAKKSKNQNPTSNRSQRLCSMFALGCHCSPRTYQPAPISWSQFSFACPEQATVRVSH